MKTKLLVICVFKYLYKTVSDNVFKIYSCIFHLSSDETLCIGRFGETKSVTITGCV